MLGMTEKMTPTVLYSAKQFGRILRLLRTVFGWSQATAAERYNCSSGLVSFREMGRRHVTVEQAAQVLAAHGYVLVVMAADDADQIPRLITGGDTLAPGAAHAFSAPQT